MAYPRTKKLTDPAYAPSNPASEAAAREQIDGAIQEVYDMLISSTVGSSGSNYVGSDPINGVSGNTVHAQLVALKEIIDSLIIGALPEGIYATSTELNNEITARTNADNLKANQTNVDLIKIRTYMEV